MHGSILHQSQKPLVTSYGGIVTGCFTLRFAIGAAVFRGYIGVSTKGTSVASAISVCVCQAEEEPGQWLEQYTGEVYVQSLASMLPVEACIKPGWKTCRTIILLIICPRCLDNVWTLALRN